MQKNEKSNRIRTDIRENSRLSTNVVGSLQSCKLSAVEHLLTSKIEAIDKHKCTSETWAEILHIETIFEDWGQYYNWTNQRALIQSSNQETESGSDPNSNWLARLNESIAAFNQRFIFPLPFAMKIIKINLWNQGNDKVTQCMVWSKWLLYCTYSCIAGWVVKFFQWPMMGFEIFSRFSGWATGFFLENLFFPPAHPSSYFMTGPLGWKKNGTVYSYVP
jgi:hypothetical protein